MSDESFAVEYFWLILLLLICTPAIITGIVCWIHDCMERNKETEQRTDPKNDVVINDSEVV